MNTKIENLIKKAFNLNGLNNTVFVTRKYKQLVLHSIDCKVTIPVEQDTYYNAVTTSKDIKTNGIDNITQYAHLEIKPNNTLVFDVTENPTMINAIVFDKLPLYKVTMNRSFLQSVWFCGSDIYDTNGFYIVKTHHDNFVDTDKTFGIDKKIASLLKGFKGNVQINYRIENGKQNTLVTIFADCVKIEIHSVIDADDFKPMINKILNSDYSNSTYKIEDITTFLELLASAKNDNKFIHLELNDNKLTANNLYLIRSNEFKRGEIGSCKVKCTEKVSDNEEITLNSDYTKGLKKILKYENDLFLKMGYFRSSFDNKSILNKIRIENKNFTILIMCIANINIIE